MDINEEKVNPKINYITTCACVDAMDRIASKTFIRMSYEYGICFLKRELIPTIASVCIKSLISNLGTLREKSVDMAVYVNLFDIITFGLVELNFEETEKATNILPDFRIGPRGCKACGMDYNKYISRQVPLDKYKSRVINVKSEDYGNEVWMDTVQQMLDALFGNVNFLIDDRRIITVFLEIFLEEVFYDLGMHKNKDYIYKLFDILYFNYIDKEDMWGTDVMPEYKLMVKNDVYSEELIEQAIEKYEKDNNKNDNEENDDQYKQGLYWQ